MYFLYNTVTLIHNYENDRFNIIDQIDSKIESLEIYYKILNTRNMWK